MSASRLTPVDIYPWHAEVARQWLGQRDRFAHAWLIHGMPGTGKQQFALGAAASLLCDAPEHGLACGHCRSCHWIHGGNHPDLRRIRPDALAAQEGEGGEAPTKAGSDEKSLSREIRVDQLRALADWFNTATHAGGWRVAVLYPADALNPVSANALLKILEEPPAHTVFLMVTDAADRLLPTLVSRCRRLPLPVPERRASTEWLAAQGVEPADAWLAAASQAPLLALHLSRSRSQPCPDWLITFLNQVIASGPNPDVAAIADLLDKVPAESWLDDLQRLVADLALRRHGLSPHYFPQLDQAAAIAQAASPRALANLGKWLCEQRRVARHPLNARLFVHAVVQRAVLACRPQRAKAA